MTAEALSPGAVDVARIQADGQLAQLCASGIHAWVPWLAITSDDGHVLHHVTYCVRCRHEEQYDR